MAAKKPKPKVKEITKEEFLDVLKKIVGKNKKDK
jgi:hypothetical protein